MPSFFFFLFQTWISALFLGCLCLFCLSHSKSMRLVVVVEKNDDSSSFHQGLGFHKEIGFSRKNRLLRSQRTTLREHASSLLQEGFASTTFDIHSDKTTLDLVGASSSNNESASSVCVKSFPQLVQAIASSEEEERFASTIIILCANETIVFGHTIDIANKSLRIQCQSASSSWPASCILKGSSTSGGLFQAIIESSSSSSYYHSISFQGITFSGGSSEFGSVVQVIASSPESNSRQFRLCGLYLSRQHGLVGGRSLVLERA